MSARFEQALAIQEGACNIAGIARSLVLAADEVRDEKQTTAAKDPAVRLIVHQLASLCNVAEIDDGMMVYHELTEYCKQHKEN